MSEHGPMSEHRPMSEHGRPAPDLHRIAGLLVRCSGVPLPTIASAFGFSEADGFRRWFEDRDGLDPEAARAEYEKAASLSPREAEPDGLDEQVLAGLRRSLFSLLEGQAVAPMVRAMRSRKPMPTDPKPRTGGRNV